MNRLLVCAAVLGLISVIMGAMGDHAFALSPEKAKSLETAIRYNMVYAVLIVAISLAPKERRLACCGWIFVVGSSFFSFGIYASLITGITQLTYLTPVGGVTMMAGWVVLAYRGFFNK